MRQRVHATLRGGALPILVGYSQLGWPFLAFATLISWGSSCASRSLQSAHTQAVHRHVSHMVDEQSSMRGEPGYIDVKVAANLVSQISYQNKVRSPSMLMSIRLASLMFMGILWRDSQNLLQAGMIVAGYDRSEGPRVFAVPLGGTLLEVGFAMGGSGSNYAYSWTDSHFREDMTMAEAERFVATAVMLAIARDGSSGGVVRTCSVGTEGVSRKHFLQSDTHSFLKGFDELVEPT